ncbi:MAG: tetratricopeptide repeat protein [Oscillospiraceae bacterium]|nr:tetratricopeptide repeat protein [Oscillospiraceae bacterium]
MENNQNAAPLAKEDYTEPCCPMNMHPEVTPIPIRRVLSKLDGYLAQNDYAAGERLLGNWLREADACGDRQGKLTVLNEQIGIYRKMGKEAECLAAIDGALALMEDLQMQDAVTGGTTLINAATGYKAFGRARDALPLYRRAQTIYETRLAADDDRLAALYNNMALTLSELEQYREAERLYEKAIAIMERRPHGEAEAAITYLNLADLLCAEEGYEAAEARIEAYLRRAEALLDTEDLPRDGNYAFVCEKCAPVFGYYGYFYTEETLKQRAREIYERT